MVKRVCSPFMPLAGERVEYDAPSGYARDDCGRRLRVSRPTHGDVLSVEVERGKAWILLDGDVEPRLVPFAELKKGLPKPWKSCCRK